jgi:parallel beta-helix repeat protein
MKDKTFCKILLVSIGLAVVASGVAVGASTLDNASNGSDLNVVKIEATDDWLDLYHPPTASFICIQWRPLIITFDASSSSDPDGIVERYKWDFGDGNSAIGMVVNHTYSSAGKYNVTLTVTDNNFLTDTKAYNITVLHYLPVHNIDTGESFSTIQLAVDDPDTKDGHTIIADPGAYEENIKVNKRLRIQSESGADLTIVQAANPDDHVFDVTVDYVNISGFGVEGSYDNAGIHLYYVDYCNISNNICSNNAFGISIDHSNHSSIINNNCTSNGAGIALFESSNNSISNNFCSSNTRYFGIGLLCSNNNSILKNICYSNEQVNGIYLGYSRNNIISNNSCSSNSAGIYLGNSTNNSISNNTCSNNSVGISLQDSNSNKLRGNILVENEIAIGGKSVRDFTHEMDMSNTVNEKPVYYWKDVDGGRVPDGAGQVILVNCKNVIVENQDLNNASVGIAVAFSSYNTIKNNNCSNNKYYGIYLLDSNSNHIFLNNFINNTDNFRSYKSANTWNSTEKITYTYNGNTYTNYLGNYWDDYKEKYPDAEEIGRIWDTPYSIDSEEDECDDYPLMKPFENYIT